MKNINRNYSSVIKTLSVLTVALLLQFCAVAQAKIEKGSPDYFTGNVWVKPLATDTAKHWLVAEVAFEKGAHSNWHFHPGKQVLVITEGLGYLQEKNKPLRVLHKNDVVTILPGTLHWHGAAPQSSFTQMVINPDTEKGVVNWLQKVSDAEYTKAK